MQLAHYIALVHGAQVALAEGFREVGRRHGDEVDVTHLCERLARRCDARAEQLAPATRRYGESGDEHEPDRLHSALLGDERSGPLALLRDLHDLLLMATECELCWTLVGQGAQGVRDEELLRIVHGGERETALQLRWLRTRAKAAAPQALVVA